MREMRPGRVLRLLMGNLLVLIAILAVLEIAARLFFPRDIEALFSDRFLRVDADFIPRHPLVRHHPTRGYSLTPGFEDRRHGVRVNAAGFRGPDLPEKLAEHFVILALGESTTWGWGVPDGSDYPSLLQTNLNERYPGANAYVINAGVPSYTSSQVLIYLGELLPKVQPELALVNILWNDIWFSTLTNWYPEVLVYQLPPRLQQLLLRYSGLYRALTLRADEGSGQANPFNSEALAHYRANLQAMVDLSRAAGIDLVFVKGPIDLQKMSEEGIEPFQGTRLGKADFLVAARTYTRALEEVARENGVPLVDHRLSLERPKTTELFLDLLHPTSLGNEMLASDVAHGLEKAGVLPWTEQSAGRLSAAPGIE